MWKVYSRTERLLSLLFLSFSFQVKSTIWDYYQQQTGPNHWTEKEIINASTALGDVLYFQTEQKVQALRSRSLLHFETSASVIHRNETVILRKVNLNLKIPPQTHTHTPTRIDYSTSGYLTLLPLDAIN